MYLEQLEIFVEVVQLGSFAAVAEKRLLNASSVSRSTQALEEELGVKLLKRSTRRLDLTEAGEIYYQQLLQILDSLNQAKQRAQDIKKELQGTLRVTMPVGLTETQLVDLIPQFRKLHPELKLELLVTNECLDLVKEKVDIGIRLGRVREDNWVAKPLKQLEYKLCASDRFLMNYSVQEPEDLQQVPCLNFIPHPSAKQWHFENRASGDTQLIWVNQVMLITNEQSAKSLCCSGEGIALLPDWLAEEDLAKGTLQEIFAGFKVSYLQADNQIWITYPNREYVPAKTRAFIDFLVKNF